MKKFAKKALAGALSLAMVMGMTAVVSPETASAKKVKVKKVTVTAPSGKTAEVAKGKKINLTATVKVTPNKKANKKVTYKSANSKIATVNKKGQVKGVKVGKTKITVTSTKNKKKKATIKVVVKKAAVKKVTINAKKATLAVGAKKTLKATVTPKKNVSKKIAWSSSKKKIASVTSKGVVKGVKEGTATITAKAADGSGKKATCKVTVGAGIKDVTVPNSGIVRVSLTSAKALTAADFTVQNKKTPDGAYNTSEGVEKIVTNDGGKTYDVQLDNVSSIMSYSYVKVTISALKIDKTKEVYVGNIPAANSYSVTDTIQRVTGKVGKRVDVSYDDDDYYESGISSLYVVGDTTGVVKYSSVEGLPEGLKAYISKDGTSVSVRGKYKKVENGTKAVVTAVDETGKTFTRTYEFYVGDENTIVGNFLGDTVLSYTPDDPNTKGINEASGYNFEWKSIRSLGDGVIAGGSGSYEYTATGLPAQVDTMSVEGRLGHAWANGSYVAVPAATYTVNVTVKDKVNPNIQATFPFTLTIVDGVTVTGTVKDATGAPAKNIEVTGQTKRDAYGNYDSFSEYTKADGTYKARLIPGEYSQMAYFNGGYDYTVGNVYTAGAAVKDLVLPLYKVNFAATVPGAIAYNDDNGDYGYYNALPTIATVYDANGVSSPIKIDQEDYTMYSYLMAGAYEFSPSAEEYNDTVYAFNQVQTSEYGTKYLEYENCIGKFHLSGAFNVAGNGTVQLTAAPILDTEG